MTWCSKIYDIFNGWNDGENELPSIESTKVRRVDSKFYRHTIDDGDSQSENGVPVLDSPFSEKSDSLNNVQYSNDQLYNTDYTNNRDYEGEHVCADTLFSCHQRDDPRSYGIATISNTPLNLPSYMGKTDDRIHQQLSRSFSFDSTIPMDYHQRSQTILPSFEQMTTAKMRHSLNQQRMYNDKTNRYSLDQSQISLQNRQESTGFRISTRSTYSISECEIQSRNNEQIEQDIQNDIQQMLTLTINGPFPMIYRPISMHDGYRIEGGYGEATEWRIQKKIPSQDCQLTSDNIASIYTSHFYEQFHYNLYSIDEDLNPIVMSVRSDNDHSIVILRTKMGSFQKIFDSNRVNSNDYVQLAKEICPNLSVESFETCSNLQAQQAIKTYDEKLETQKFKFGIIYQRKGQTTEEEFFNNEKHSRTFDDFLETIATRVSLKNFKGYRGGLDISEQTDSPISYYECYGDKEIMFHVSTLLPFTPNDSSQIQRKRHIGNDIVTIVFQEDNTPFHPSMIKSNFLHVFLVIQPVQVRSIPCYKIMLIAREDIEEFPPSLQPNTVYTRTAEQLKSFLLSKLINAEYAAYRCRTFSLLQERTRFSFLKNLCENLTEKSFENLCEEHKRFQRRRSSILSNSTRKRYLSSVKKIFTKSNSMDPSNRQSTKSEQGKIKPNKKLIKLGKSMDSVEDYQHYSLPTSSNSLNDMGDLSSSTIQNQPYYGDESDEGLDSMSSADTPHAPYDSDDPDVYRQQLREKALPSQIWHRASKQRHIFTPQTTGIHISEETTV